MYKLCFFVPVTHIEKIKKALFSKGAGRTEKYDQCCWQVLGEGQFRPLQDSQPFIGVQDKVEIIAEYKVEMVCEDKVIVDVVKQLLKSHPYQQPAYEIIKIMMLEDLI